MIKKTSISGCDYEQIVMGIDIATNALDVIAQNLSAYGIPTDEIKRIRDEVSRIVDGQE